MNPAKHAPASILASLYKLGIGIREMADASGLDPTHVSRIMRGELGAAGLAPAIAGKLAAGLEQLAVRHAARAAACRKGAKAIRRTVRTS